MITYKRLFRHLILIGIGCLGLFNSTKLEMRYEPNTNYELLCQNGMIISSVIIVYFSLAFIIEFMVISSSKRVRKKPKNHIKKTEQLALIKGEEE
tara:strand:- start:2064 stop:2348 length:285 start_codon:yes stop_codon:yes gene_type:complete